MATIKHISSKNADYGAAEQYLTFEHDEFNMKPVKDEAGRMVPRKGYKIETVNCGEEDFAISCLQANMQYKKNSQRQDIKSHHYIISFEPRDADDNGLTVEKAQKLGMEYCKKHFPGHQALVCTHPDGHTIPATSMYTSSSIPCASMQWSGKPTWTGHATHRKAQSIAVPLLLCGISGVKSWRCASVRDYIRLTC